MGVGDGGWGANLAKAHWEVGLNLETRGGVGEAIDPLRPKKPISLEPNVGLTSNQAANLSFYVVYRSMYKNDPYVP